MLTTLADERTANLDSATGESIIELMKRINRERGTTFIYSTHDQAIVSIADHIIRLKDGVVEYEVQPKGGAAGRGAAAGGEPREGPGQEGAHAGAG